jgi:hypothetical protein
MTPNTVFVSQRLKPPLMMQSPPCMVEKVADRFRLGQKDRRVAGSPPITWQLKLELSPGQKVRIELQGRATTVNIPSQP